MLATINNNRLTTDRLETELRIALPGSISKGKPETLPQGDETLQAEAPLCCVACNAAITTQDQRITINGSHDHAFFNPAGLAFEIQCFRNAPGCTHRGEPDFTFSWFKGYSWQVGLCGKCHAHLGWFFSGRESGFYGLIVGSIR